MRRIVLSVTAALLAFSAVAQAQTTVSAMPNMFPTLSACQEAVRAGRFRFYEPRYFGLKTRNPVNDQDRIVVPLESDTCLEMLVVGGRQFVAQREGTAFRARKLADGSLALYARNDCGNPVYGVVYLPPPPVEPPPQQVREPTVQTVTPLRRDPPQPPGPLPERRETRVSHEKKGGFCSSKKCRWGLVAVGVVGGGYAAWRYWPCPPGTVRR